MRYLSLLAFTSLLIFYFTFKNMAETSEFKINKMELKPISLFEKSGENQVFTNNRLRLRFSGLCISLSQDRRLIAVYCDPNKSQSFSLSTDGKLVFNENGYCVRKRNIASLKFPYCYDAWLLTIANNFYLQSIERNAVVQCLTPASNTTGIIKVTKFPKPGDEIKLMECDESASRIELMEETAFSIILLYSWNTIMQICVV